MSTLSNIARRLTGRGSTVLPPLGLGVTLTVVFWILANNKGVEITDANGYDVMQNMANLGGVAVAIGLTMIAGEFDLSIPAMYALGGAVAVQTGGSDPLLGIGLALAVGLAAGAIHGVLIARFQLSSVPVTLGGLLTMQGITYTITHGDSIPYPDLKVSGDISSPILTIFSARSLIILGVIAAIAALLFFTKLGPELRAVGGDKRAARVAGVRVNRVLIATFMASAAFTSLSGALLDYSLAGTSPNVQLTPLIFAVTASVFGGVGIAGGRGSVPGIALGAIALSILSEGLVVIAAPAYATNIVTGGLLFVVGIISAPEVLRRARLAGRRLGDRRAPGLAEAGT